MVNEISLCTLVSIFYDGIWKRENKMNHKKDYLLICYADVNLVAKRRHGTHKHTSVAGAIFRIFLLLLLHLTAIIYGIHTQQNEMLCGVRFFSLVHAINHELLFICTFIFF